MTESRELRVLSLVREPRASDRAAPKGEQRPTPESAEDAKEGRRLGGSLALPDAFAKGVMPVFLQSQRCGGAA